MSDKEKRYEVFEEEEEPKKPKSDTEDLPFVSYRDTDNGSFRGSLWSQSLNNNDKTVENEIPETKESPEEEWPTHVLPETTDSDLLKEFSIGDPEENAQNVTIEPDTEVSEGIVTTPEDSVFEGRNDESNKKEHEASPEPAVEKPDEEEVSTSQEQTTDEVDSDEGVKEESTVENTEEENMESLSDTRQPQKGWFKRIFTKKDKAVDVPKEESVDENEETGASSEPERKESIVKPMGLIEEMGLPPRKKSRWSFKKNAIDPEDSELLEPLDISDAESSPEETSPEEKDGDSHEEEMSSENEGDETSESEADTRDKPVEPKPKRIKPLLYIVGGGVVVGAALMFAFSQSEGNPLSSLLSNTFGTEEGVELSDGFVPPTEVPTPIPVDPSVDPTIPVEAPTEEDKEKVDPKMQELERKLKPVFESFKGYIDVVEKTDQKIVVKGTITNEYLIEVNRLVRAIQIESLPYMEDKVSVIQVDLNKGKTLMTYETSKTVIDFISELNYEDRHSSQLWWRKTTALKNGRNIKATQTKDRLYVEYMHPIYPAVETPPAEQKEETTSSDEKSEPKKKDPAEDEYTVYENNMFGLFFEHLKGIEVEEEVEDNKTLYVQSKETKDSLFAFKIKTSTEHTKLTGTEEEKRKKLFVQNTLALEKENPDYVALKKNTLENFVKQDIEVQSYEVKEKNVTYYVIYALAVVGDHSYEFYITQESEDGLEAELLLLSTNLGNEEIVSPTDDTKNKESEEE